MKQMFMFLCYRKYCLSACDVEDPEVRFNVDQYSDVTMITKPVVYISVGEIVDTHQVQNYHVTFVAVEFIFLCLCLFVFFLTQRNSLSCVCLFDMTEFIVLLLGIIVFIVLLLDMIELIILCLAV